MESRLTAPGREGLLASVFHGSRQGVAVARLEDGCILEANDPFAFLLGCPRDEIVGATTVALGLWSEFGDQHARDMLNERGAIEGFDTHVPTPSGEHRILHLWAEVVHVEGESYVVVRVSDVDGHASAAAGDQELRKTEARYRALVEQTPAIFYVDANDDLSTNIYTSPQIERILGITGDQWREDPGFWMAHMHEDDRERVMSESRRTNETGEPFRCEYRLFARDGRVVWFRDEAVPVEDPATGLRFWQGVMLDITDQKRAEERLIELEAKYRSLVERIPALIYTEVTDESRPSGSRATFVGPLSEELLGYTPEELVNDPQLWDLIVHPDDRGRTFEIARRSEAGGRLFSHEYRVVRQDGEIRWVHDEAKPIDEPASGLLVWQGFMLDITDQKRAEERLIELEAKYRTLVEQIPAVVYLGEYGEDGRWLYISPQIERLLGYTPQEWLAHPHPMQSFTHPDDIAAARAEEARSQREGDAFRAEYRMQTKEGRWVWILDEAAAVRDETGRPLVLQGTMFDMTERKRAEEELAEAVEQLRALDRLKDTLLHTLAHDLKGPLTAIMGAASTLERLDRQLPEDERRNLLRTMASRTRAMNTLLTDLLDLERLDKGIVEPRRSPVDLGELIRNIATDPDLTDGRAVDVEAGRVMLNVDGPKLERVVENLVVNAIRHTPADRHVWVRLVPQDGGVVIAVEDDGPGVSDELKQEIFEAFRRGPDADGLPGSGIGLSLVARFVELHGGRAWVEDRAGGGASFRVLLPDLPPSVS